jgi:site-specific recombinase XerD
MIHRQNYLDVRAYLDHIQRVRQNDPATVKRARGHLRHLLEWADHHPFVKARLVDPTFPSYVLTARADGQARTLAPVSIAKCLANARQFFTFARAEWPLRYKPISESWIELLQPPRHVRMDSRLPVREFWTLDNVHKIVAVSTETLREERGKVAVCMLFLSGMRADALASIPIACVDLDRKAIYQLPERGVRTKNRKAAITYLLHIPELLEVIKRWEALLSTFHLPPSTLWYATLSTDGMQFTPTSQAFTGRNNVIQRDIKLICKKADVPYLSPHKLRHGHTVYALKRAQNVAQLKAISQNIMHKSLVTTDQIYGKLLNDDVQEIIASL